MLLALWVVCVIKYTISDTINSFIMQKKLTLAIILLFTLSSNAFAAEKTQGIKFEEYKGSPVPDDIPIFDETGNKHYLEEYEGKTLLIVFWATWCSPCVQEMLDLDTLQKDFRKLPFAILPIAEDHQGIKVVESFYKQNDIRHLPLLHDYRNALFNAFSVVGMPTSFLVTEDGMNVAVFKGVVNWHDDEVRAIILSHIPGNPAEPKNSYKERSLNQVIHKPKSSPSEADIKEPKEVEGKDASSKTPAAAESGAKEVDTKKAEKPDNQQNKAEGAKANE